MADKPPAPQSRPGSSNANDNDENRQQSLLQIEASSAVREVAGFLKSISLSAVLNQSDDLLFLNIETLESQHYCVELSQRGWRICSNRHDCMNGDFRNVSLFIKYYETIYQLLDSVSPKYREQFGQALANKLQGLPPQ